MLDARLTVCSLVGLGRVLWLNQNWWCRAMIASSSLPVSIKCRIGIDEMDPEIGLDHFIDLVADAG